MNQININDLIQNGSLSVSVEHQEDRLFRLRRQEVEASTARQKDLAKFYVLLTILVITFGLCIFIILNRNAELILKQWAMSVLTGIISGFVGFTIGNKAA